MSHFDDMPQDEFEDENYKSKTEIKREMEELQELGTKIVELSEKHIGKIPLEGELEQAIYQARGMKHREGRRRQLQFIGKLMRQDDNIDGIRAAYQKIISIGQQHTKVQHQTEQWRDRLLGDDKKALQDFLSEFPDTEVQHLRQLIRNSQKEISQQKPPSASRKLFRYIREIIENA